jgi:hypothetical protein
LIFENDILSFTKNGIDTNLREVLDSTLWTNHLLGDLFSTSIVDQRVHWSVGSDEVRITMKDSHFQRSCGRIKESVDTLLRENYETREREMRGQRVKEKQKRGEAEERGRVESYQ